MATRGSAILEAGIKFVLDYDSIKKVSKESQTSVQAVVDKITNLKIGDALKEQVYDALHSIKNEFSNLKLGDINDSFVREVNSATGIEEQQKAAEKLVDTVNLLKTATSGYTLNIFESLDSEKIQKLIKLTKDLVTAQTDVQKASAKAQINDIISPLLKQYSEAEQIYQKIKKMGINDVADRLFSLGDRTKSGTLETTYLREAIPLLEKYFALLKQGESVDYKKLGLSGIKQSDFDENFFSLSKYIDERKQKLSKSTTDFLNNYNYISQQDLIKSNTTSETPLKIQVEPDFTGFHEKVNDELKKENESSSLQVNVKPVITDSSDLEIKTSLNLDSTKEIVKDIIDQLTKLKQALANVEETLANGFHIKSVSELETEFKTITDSAEQIPKTTSKSFKVASQEFKDYVDKIRQYKEEGGTRGIFEFASNKTDADKIEKQYQKSVEAARKAAEAQKKQQQEISASAEKTNEIIGSDQIKALQESVAAIKKATEQELKNFTDINNSLEKVISNFEKIKDAFSSNVSFNGFSDQLTEIAMDIESLNTKLNLKEVFKGLRISQTTIKNIKDLGPALAALNKQIDQLQLNGNSSAFVKQITELMKQGEALKSLATVLNAYEGGANKLNYKGGDVDAYKEAKEILTQLIVLEKQRKTATGETATEIDKTIAEYSDPEALNSMTKQINASKILTDAQKTEIELLQKKLAIETISSDQYIQEQASATEKNNQALEDTVKAMSDVTSAAKDTADSLEKATSSAENLKGAITDIKKVTKTTTVNNSGVVNSKYGYQTESGSITLDGDGNFKSTRKTIVDVTGALTDYDNAIKIVQDSQTASENSTKEFCNNYKLLVVYMYQAAEAFHNFYEENKNNPEQLGSDKFQKLASDLKEAKTAVDDLKEAEKGASENSRSKLVNSIYDWIDKNGKGYSVFKTQIDGIVKTIAELGPSANLEELQTQFLNISSAINKAGLSGKTFGQQVLDQVVSKAASFVTTFLSIQDVIRYTQQAFQTINELDYALVDLSKTANMSTSQLNDFYLSSSDVAKQMGVTTKEIIDQASAWARLGYNTNEAATTMAQLSSQFASISPGMSTDTAQEGLVSVMKAWNIDVDDVKREIMDNINTLGNNFAENNEDIITGMEKASAALAATGTSYKDAFALFTGGQEIIQNAESMGTALRTISLRIHGYSEESTDDNLQLDDSLKTLNGDLIDLTKTASNPQGISTFTDETKNLADESKKEFKPLIEYLGELSDAWDTFGDKQKSDLLQALFGKNRSSQGAAIITNFDQVRASLEAMDSAAGSSDREMEKIEGSIDYKVNALKQTWIGFLQVMADRDAIKAVIDLLTKLSELLTKVLETPGLNVGVVAGTAVGFVKLASALRSAVNPAMVLKKAMDGAFGTNTTKEIKDTITAVDSVIKKMREAEAAKAAELNAPQNAKTVTKIFGANEQVLTTVDTANTAANTEANLANAASNEQKAASEAKDTAAKQGNIAATEVDNATTDKNTKANEANDTAQKSVLKTILSLVKAHPLLTAAIAAAAVGVTAFIVKLKNEATHIDDVRSKVKDLTESYQTNLSTVKTNTSDAKDLYAEYSKLAKGVDSLGNNKSLSDSNFDRYNELTDQLAEKMPGLVTGWTNQNHAILECKDSVEALNAEIDKQNLDAYRKILIGDDGSGAKDIVENYQNAVNGYDGKFLGHIKGASEKENDLDFVLKKTQELQTALDQLKESGNNIEDFVKYASSPHLFADNTFSPILDKINTLKYLMKNSGLNTDGLKINFDTIQSWNDLDAAIYDVQSDINSEKTDLSTQVDEAVSGVQQLADAYLHLYNKDGKTFYDLSDDMAASVSYMIQSLDEDVLNQFGVNTKADVQKIVNTMVETMLNDPTLGNAIVQLFTLDQSQSVEAARATAEPYLDALNKAFKKGDIPQTLYDLIVGNLDWIDDVESKLNGAIAGALSGDIDTEQAKLNSIKQEATENEKTGFKDAQLHNETLANDQKKINDLTQEQLEIEKQINVAKAERQAKYSSSDMMGNVDLNNRPVVSGINMSAAGLEGDADSYSTVYTYTKPFDNPIDGNPWIVQFTPILPDGTVMTEDSCYEYIHDLINKASSKEDMMSMDNPENGGKGIFMGVFDSYTDETGKTKSLNWNNVDQGYKQYNQEAIARHDNQASIYDNEGELVQQQVKNQKALSEAQEKYQNDLKQSGNASDYYSQKIEEQQKKTSNLSQAEKTLTNYMNKLDTAQAQQDFATYLNSLGKTISTAAEAKAAIRGFKVEAQNSGNSFDISGLSTAIESLEKVNTAYQKVAENIKDNKTGKDITSSIKDIEALRKEFEDISNTDLNWGDFDGFEDIERTLTDGSSSAKEMQSAFDQLYTTLAQDKLAANDFDESTQSLVSSQLQAAGASKESADAWVAQQVAIHNAKKAVSDYGINLQTVTQGDINELTTEGSVSQDTAQYLSLLALQTQLASNTVFDTEASREQLYALAEAAGIARDEIASVYSQSSISKMAGSGADQSTINKIKKQQSKTVDDIRKEVENKLQDKINNIHLAPTTTSTPKSSGGGGGSSKSEEKDEYVEEFEKQYKELGELRDNDKIDEYEYCQYLRALYEKFFKDKAKYIEQYQKYESEYLSKMKSVYENIFSGLSSKIDDRISKLDKQKSKETSAVKEQKTAAVSALKAQKQAAVNAIEAQIKALKEQQKQLEKQIDIYQGQIDAINDANDAREREIALQKALYDLDKLQNQRTNLTYSESQGMHYESDLSGIRDARESVQDAKDDIEIANIQKKIDLLNKEKDLLDDQIDALNDKKDAIEDYYDTLIDETEAYYDNLITQIEAAYEKQTENLNNAKEKLDKIKEYFSDAQLAAQISEMTGQSVNSILDAFQSGDEKFLDSLQLQYAEVIKDMMSDNQTFLDSFSQVSNIDMSGVTGFLEKTQDAFKGIENTNFDVVKDGIKSVEEAFGSLDDKIAVSNLFGANSDFEKTATEAAEKAGTTFTSSLSNFFESDESAFGAGKEAAKKVAEGMTSDGAKTEVESKGKEVATTAANSVKTAATSDPDVQAANEEAGKAVTSGVGKGMVSDDAKAETDAKGKEVATAAANSVKTAAISDADVQAASKEAGKSLTTNIMSGATEGLSDSDFQDKLQAFVDGIAQKIQEAFSKLDTSNLLDFSSMFSTVDDASKEGQSTSNIFSQMLQDVQNFATEFANIDISPVVQQFSDLRDAVVETSQAITGEGGTSSGSDQTTGTSTGGKSKKGGKQSSSSQSNSGSGGSLADAMQAFGDTSNEVLGGSGEEGGDDEGSGVIGQFTTLKTKVEEVAATLGSGDETGGGGKSGGKSGGKGAGAEESGTLISALQAVGETAMDEEIGLPKQIEEWGKVSDGIGQCIDALNDFKNGLNELKSFTITVEFASEFAEAAGTMSNESGAAHFQGTAFARGNAGLQSDQRALVGEQGPEMKISGNRWSLVGKNGAEYADLKAGDIIFSAAQTKELMKHGKLHSRGRTVGGNAYADGTPLGNAIRFAGSDHSSAQLAALAAKLTGTIGIMTSGIDSIERAASELTKNVSNVTNNSANQETNVSIGDIYLQGVNDTDSLAKAIKSYLPGAMLQQLHKT